MFLRVVGVPRRHLGRECPGSGPGRGAQGRGPDLCLAIFPQGRCFHRGGWGKLRSSLLGWWWRRSRRGFVSAVIHSPTCQGVGAELQGMRFSGVLDGPWSRARRSWLMV